VNALSRQPTRVRSVFHLHPMHIIYLWYCIAGKAVSKFCSKHLHKEVVKSQAYASGDLAAGLEHAFLR